MTQLPQSDQRSAIERMLAPRSVALLGVSASGGSLAGIVLANLERFDFCGDIHLVHPRAEVIGGRACLPAIADLPFGVDCAVLAIPPAGVPEAVRACAARGVGGVIIFSAGFAELGEAGRHAQEEIGRIAADAGMAVMGPNCLGFINYADGVPLSFSATEPCPPTSPGIAVASQSGAMAAVVRAALHARALDVTLSISTGNEAANGLEDYLAHVLERGHTRLVAVIAEHLRSPTRFLRLADRARELGKPIVLLHPGRSAEARASAETHTGAMTGDHVMMRTGVSRHGVLVVETLEELVDVCECLVRMHHQPRKGTAILGESGAFKAMMLDYCKDLGLALPQPEGDAADALAQIAPGLILPTNPVDMTAQILVRPELYRSAIGPLMSTPGIASVMVSIILSSRQMADQKLPPIFDILAEAARDHAVVFAMLGEDTDIGGEAVSRIRAMGVPFFRSPERALRAIARISCWRDRQDVMGGPIGAVRVPQAERLPDGVLPEYKAKQLLAEAGLPTVRFAMATTIEDAVAKADAIGFPVVLKAQSARLSHKSDAGGVALNIDSKAALRTAWARMHDDIGRAVPGLELDGVLVESMAAKGLELILGARRDPEWGPVIAVGLGGVLTEALHDLCYLPTDLPRAAVMDEIAKLKGAALLGAFRGAAPRDLDALYDCIHRLGLVMQAHPEISEVDINPLLLFEEGKGAAVLDALVRVG